ncbi:MAG TPA: anhydro-N-acetylmuramic acid kinase [Puia sp.]|nr:anhydro-N-acetylmuramic acid kinase [Puia sp.]
MVYKVIGLMSGSSLDGLDIVYVHLQEGASSIKDNPRKWEFSILHAACYPYSKEWREKLATARELSAGDYLLLHTAYGRYLGEQVLRFIEEHGLHYQVQLIASHGHTTFHAPEHNMTAQLGDGAALAAVTGINVVSDLRAMDVALGGQGAPIVPVGERLLLQDYAFFLNLGGIANVSAHGHPGVGAGDAVADGKAGGRSFVAFDVCPANRVLNILAGLAGKEYDANGALAAGGKVDEGLLGRLNALPYYDKPYPKSLANEFGTETVLPMIREGMGGDAASGRGGRFTVEDGLRTYVEHIAIQIRRAVEGLGSASGRMLVTGGGAHNGFLIGRLRELLAPQGIEVVAPDAQLVDYKEALVMALIGVLRWREENNVYSSVTGASRDSIGGAVWIGQEV